MAQVIVDSGVMRDKAKSISDASVKINTLYNDMLQDVNNTAGKMEGETIETQRSKFESMKTTFEKFATDIKSYSEFLNKAADAYDQAESEGLTKAQEQGKVF